MNRIPIENRFFPRKRRRKARIRVRTGRKIVRGFLGRKGEWWVVAALVLAGCGARVSAPEVARREELRPVEPVEVTAGVSGFYARDEERNGWMWVNVWPGDSLIDCTAVLQGWTLWRGSPLYDKRSEFTQVVATFDLFVSLGGEVTSRLLAVDLYDGRNLRPWPDSLGEAVAWVDGRYSAEDSFYVGQVQDTTDGIWKAAYEVGPGFVVMAHLGAVGFGETTTAENLRRIGPYHAARGN